MCIREVYLNSFLATAARCRYGGEGFDGCFGAHRRRAGVTAAVTRLLFAVCVNKLRDAIVRFGV